jgi:hypothetical protein
MDVQSKRIIVKKISLLILMEATSSQLVPHQQAIHTVNLIYLPKKKNNVCCFGLVLQSFLPLIAKDESTSSYRRLTQLYNHCNIQI